MFTTSIKSLMIILKAYVYMKIRLKFAARTDCELRYQFNPILL